MYWVLVSFFNIFRCAKSDAGTVESTFHLDIHILLFQKFVYINTELAHGRIIDSGTINILGTRRQLS